MKIKNLRKREGSGKIRAFFSVELTPQITVNEMKLMEGEDGNLWCATPNREYTDKEGKKKWSPIVYMGEELRLKITDMAREEYFGRQSQSDEDIPF